MTKTFRYQEDMYSETGEYGLAPLNMPTFNAFSGLGVMHDIFEHYYKDDRGQLHFELMAVGASLYVRGDYAGHSAIPWAKNWRNIFSQIYEYAFLNTEFSSIDPIKPQKPITNNYSNENVEDSFADVLEQGIELLRSEIDYSITGYTLEDYIQDLRLYAIHYMRLGYRMAAKRYRNYIQWELNGCFDECVKNINTWISNANDAFEYDIITVTITPSMQVIITNKTEAERIKEW